MRRMTGPAEIPVMGFIRRLFTGRFRKRFPFWIQPKRFPPKTIHWPVSGGETVTAENEWYLSGGVVGAFVHATTRDEVAHERSIERKWRFLPPRRIRAGHFSSANYRTVGARKTTIVKTVHENLYFPDTKPAT